MISKGMVDEVQYNRTGNQVTLVKRFGPDNGPPAGAPTAEPANDAPQCT
jgi:hypothetical protein